MVPLRARATEDPVLLDLSATLDDAMTIGREDVDELAALAGVHFSLKGRTKSASVTDVAVVSGPPISGSGLWSI